MPEDSLDSNLTIAQAVEHFGVSERTLRRTLSLARFTGRTQVIERQTKKGRRLTTTLPPDLLSELASYFAEQGLLDSPAEAVAIAGTLGGDTAAASESVPVNEELYQRLITEKDARIEDLQAALLRERENLEVERESHRRAEMLHAGILAELQAARERLREVESHNAKLIEALPIQEEKLEQGSMPSGESEPHGGFWRRLFRSRTEP